MKMKNSRLLIVSLVLGLFLILGLMRPVQADFGTTLVRANVAFAMISRARDLQNKFQGPDGAPIALQSPIPMAGGAGEYVCPYGSNGQIADWASKGIAASLAASAGSGLAKQGAMTAGTSLLAKVVPFSGLFASKAADKVGEAVEEQSAAMAMGGWDAIREGTDYSFNNIDELAVFMHANFVDDEKYADAVAAVMSLYPDMQDRYEPAVEAAVQLAYANPAAQPAIAQVSAPASAPVVDPAPAEQAQLEAEVQPDESPASQAKALNAWASFWAKEQAAGSEESMSSDQAQAEVEVELDPLPVGMNTSEDTMSAIQHSESAGEALPPPPMAQADFAHDQWVDQGQKEKPTPGSRPATKAQLSAAYTGDLGWVEHEDVPAPKARQRYEKRPVNRSDRGQLASQAAIQQPALAPLQKPVVPSITVEQRLQALQQRRVSGELTGDEYLAERRRLIYGE